jgi:hypothetical protein
MKQGQKQKNTFMTKRRINFASSLSQLVPAKNNTNDVLYNFWIIDVRCYIVGSHPFESRSVNGGIHWQKGHPKMISHW